MKKKQRTKESYCDFWKRVWYDAKVNQFLKDAMICATINAVAVHRILNINLGRVWACGVGHIHYWEPSTPETFSGVINKNLKKRKKKTKKNGQCQSFICTRKSAF